MGWKRTKSVSIYIIHIGHIGALYQRWKPNSRSNVALLQALRRDARLITQHFGDHDAHEAVISGLDDKFTRASPFEALAELSYTLEGGSGFIPIHARRP